jgi:cytochrome P450
MHGAVQIAGRDTTAVCLTWLFYEVSQHPDVEAKVRRTPREGTERGGEAVSTQLARLYCIDGRAH